MLTIVTLIITIFFAAGRLRSDTRLTVQYLDEARTVATSNKNLSEQFRVNVLERLRVMDRAEFQTLMEGLQEEASKDVETMAGVEVTPEAAQAAAFLELAVSSWADGLDEFAPALLQVVDEPDSSDAMDALSVALVDLQIGDRTYARFVESASKIDGVDVSIEFPAIAYLPEELKSLRRTEGIASVVAEAEGLVLVRDLEISSVRLVPSESGNDGEDLVLPSTEALTVQAVVGNQGNQAESTIRVSVTLQEPAGKVIDQEVRDVSTLESHDSTTVQFDNLPVKPGERYVLLVAVTVLPGDADVENNVRHITLRINEPSS